MTATRFSNSLCLTRPDTGQSGTLVRIYPAAGIGQTFEVDQTLLLIGRDSECDLAIADDSVSRRHATLEWDGQHHVVRDLGSTNGTFVGEQRVQSFTLCCGDRIRFGNQIFKYLSPAAVETEYHELVYRMMTTDGLTQAFNKRYLLDVLERELDIIRRQGSSLAILVMDLDRFKSVNDTHGHLAGDAVLAEFAHRIRPLLRRGDVLARFGGEEFVVLCPRTSLEDGALVAERIRAAAAAEPVVFEAISIPITVSIGLSGAHGPDAPAASQLLDAADQQLYRAKHSGRNRVCHPGN